MVDPAVSEAAGRKVMRVRLSPRAPQGSSTEGIGQVAHLHGELSWAISASSRRGGMADTADLESAALCVGVRLSSPAQHARVAKW